MNVVCNILWVDRFFNYVTEQNSRIGKNENFVGLKKHYIFRCDCLCLHFMTLSILPNSYQHPTGIIDAVLTPVWHVLFYPYVVIRVPNGAHANYLEFYCYFPLLYSIIMYTYLILIIIITLQCISVWEYSHTGIF